MGQSYQKTYNLFSFHMKKRVWYFYFRHIYLRTREAVLCYPGSGCQQWMAEIMWFLSILILTGAPFQKGQEWQSKKFSRECFITCLENMKQFNPLDCLRLPRKGCISRTQDVAKNTEQQDLGSASAGQSPCGLLGAAVTPSGKGGCGLT